MHLWTQRVPRLLSRAGLCGLAVGAALAALLMLLSQAGRAWADDHVVSEGQSIQAAIDGAAPGDTVIILAGRYTESLTLDKAVSLVGESRDSVIVHALPGQRVLTVTGAAIDSSVVISGMTLMGGDLWMDECPDGCGGGVLITDMAQPWLENLVLRDNYAPDRGGGLYAGKGSPLTLHKVQVLSNTANQYGGGIYANALLTLTDFLFENNYGHLGGGGLYANPLGSAGQVVVAQGLFTGNLASVDAIASGVGGAIYLDCFDCGGLVISETTFENNRAYVGGGVTSGSPLTVAGSSFLRNYAQVQGGGLFGHDDVTIDHTDFISNTAVRDYAGGALVIGNAVVDGATFEKNTAHGLSGGGLQVEGDAHISGSHFAENYTGEHGGGASVWGAVYLTSTSFVSNSAAFDGGGLRSRVGGHLLFGTFEGNTAGEIGGGVHADDELHVSGSFFQANAARVGGALSADESLALTDTQFLTNTAANAGGAVVILGENDWAHVDGGLFQGNHASDNGGGLYAESLLTLSGTQFVSNTAGQLGGGLFAEAALTLTHPVFMSNTAAGTGGGGAYALAPVRLTGGLFQSNVLTNGSGAGLHTRHNLILEGTHFVDNYANYEGGGAYVWGEAQVTNARFERNTADTYSGGGLFVQFSSSLTDTVFISNTAVKKGGGLNAENGLSLLGGEFVGNTADHGGGAQIRFEPSVVSGTRFVNNQAAHTGGGLGLEGMPAAQVVNVLLAGNSANEAGEAIRVDDSDGVEIVHTTIVGHGDHGIAAIFIDEGQVSITNTLITSHTIGIELEDGAAVEDYNLFHAVDTPTAGTVSSGGHSLQAAPLFVDAAAGDYRLRANSPGVDQGTDVGVAVDFEGDARPNGAGFDIGYDESVNQPPVAADDAYTTAEDTPLVVAAPGVLGNDTDANGDTLQAALAQSPLSGTLAFSPDGAFVFTPTLDASGVFTFTYAASDGVASSAPALVTVTVTPVNDLPTLSALGALTVTLGQAVDPIPFTVGDVETPAGALTVTAESSNEALVPASGLLLGGSGAARTLTLTPNPGATGTTTITLTVTDGDGGEASVAFEFTVVGYRLYLVYVQR